MTYALSTEDCIRVVATTFGFRPKQLVDKSRARPVTRARFAACLLAHDLCGKSYPQIGKVLNRDHSTVMHAVAKAKNLNDPEHELFNAEFAQRVDEAQVVLETAKRNREVGEVA